MRRFVSRPVRISMRFWSLFSQVLRSSRQFAGASSLWVTVTILAGPAKAQEWSPGGYLNAYGGANLMSAVTVSTLISSYKGADVGYRAGLAMGYEWRPWLSFELDTGFQQNSLSEPQPITLKAMPLLLNAIFRFRNSTRITPYLGMGAGGAVSTLDERSGADLNLVLAGQLTAGVEYELTPQLRAGVLYKFFGMADQDYSVADTRFQVKDAYSHFIGASLNWNF